MNLEQYVQLIDSTIYKTGNQDVKYILRNPVDIQMNDILKFHPWNDFIVSPKADGMRVVLVIHNNLVILMFSTHLQVIAKTKQNGLSVFECELV
jgi:hypothetical protein